MKKHFVWIGVFLFFLSMSSITVNGQEADSLAIDDAFIFFVHGVPGKDLGEIANFPVDLYVNGVLKKTNLKYGQIMARFKVTPGNVTIAVYRTGMGPGAGFDPIIQKVFKLQYYENSSIVVYLGPEKMVKLVKFTNDTSLTGHVKKCRIIFHNTSEEYFVTYWLYNNVRRLDYHPWFENDVFDNGDKNAIEVSKKMLDDSLSFIWRLEIGIGAPDFHIVYDKPFAFQPRKGILVFFVGAKDTNTFRVLRKVVPLK